MYNKRFQNQRKSTRLENYDYSISGTYFVTICTQIRDTNWFGQITREGMQLNDIGQMILEIWNELPNRFDIQLDTFISMPDHIHGIIILSKSQTNTPHQKPVGEGLVPSLPQPMQNAIPNVTNDNALHREINVDNALHRQINADNVLHRETTRVPPTDGGVSLFDVVGAFKSLTTNAYIRGVCELGWLPFEKRFWERSFYDSVIRDVVHLEKIRAYILGNPVRWFEARGLL